MEVPLESMRREPGKSEGVAGEGPPALTTFHVRRARVGDEDSLAWVVERFSPLLRVAAEHRLGRVLRSIYEPDDLVQEVWLVALPKLAEISARDERYTP